MIGSTPSPCIWKVFWAETGKEVTATTTLDQFQIAAEGMGSAMWVEGIRKQAKDAVYKLVDGKLLLPPVQEPHVPIYFGGSSPAAHAVAAEHADVYLTWGEPPAAVAEKLADVRRRAAELGRTVRFGIRLHVIVRESDDEAWRAAADLSSRIASPEAPCRVNTYRRSRKASARRWTR